MNNTLKIARPLAMAAGVLMLPLAAAVPAHATTTSDGCTVSPERPVYSGKNNGSNIPLIDYKVTATCDLGVTLHLSQVRMEQDTLAREGDAKDDQTGTFNHDFTFPNGGTKHITVRVPLPNTGPASEGPTEEVYQKVSFSVTNGNTNSAPTPFELTQTRSIHH
jgi:hypothetical protein